MVEPELGDLPFGGGHGSLNCLFGTLVTFKELAIGVDGDDDFFSLTEVGFHFQHKFCFLFVCKKGSFIGRMGVCYCFCELHCQHTA